MADDEHDPDVDAADRAEDTETEPAEGDEARQEARRERREERKDEKLDGVDEQREEEAAEDANVDNHRDAPPFES